MSKYQRCTDYACPYAVKEGAGLKELCGICNLQSRPTERLIIICNDQDIVVRCTHVLLIPSVRVWVDSWSATKK
jgi:hypothetical protein